MDNIPAVRRHSAAGGCSTGAAGVAAAGALGGAFAAPVRAAAAGDGYGLRIVDRNENGGRLQYYRFATDAIGWDPAVNVLLPDGYHTSGKRYPVLYLLHGGRRRTSARSTCRTTSST